MIQDKGRLDWMPRRKVWKIVVYVGQRDVIAGYASDRETACLILQDCIKEMRGR